MTILSWNIDAGYIRQTYNWYGIPNEIFTTETINDLDPKHVYNGFDFGGEINFDDLFVNKGSVRFKRFADDYDSAENHFTAKAIIEFPVRDELIKTHFKFDYLGGSFDESGANNGIDYGNFQLGVSPSYQLIQDDLTINLGISAYFLNDFEASESKFFLYPNITASYKLVDDILIPYGGITGDLIQNTYQDFANENPFVSPNLFIVPKDQQYNAFIGLKGKLSNTMSYNVRGNYYAEQNKALFRSNSVDIDDMPERENFFYGNSFGVVYDDVTTFSILGELNVDVNRNFNLGIKAEYFTYNTDDQAEAWNLPDFKASLFLDYQIDEHWFAGANLYYTGERKSLFTATGSTIDIVPSIINLDSYFDANAHVGYRINDRWSVYAKANNIANQDYSRWLNYPVQGIQFLAGATYKFDF